MIIDDILSRSSGRKTGEESGPLCTDTKTRKCQSQSESKEKGRTKPEKKLLANKHDRFKVARFTKKCSDE